MNHDKKAIKFIKKVHRKKYSTKEEYFDFLRTNLMPNGYVIEKYPIYENRQWYMLIYRKEDLTLLSIIKCGYFNHELFGTQDVTIYNK